MMISQALCRPKGLSCKPDPNEAQHIFSLTGSTAAQILRDFLKPC